MTTGEITIYKTVIDGYICIWSWNSGEAYKVWREYKGNNKVIYSVVLSFPFGKAALCSLLNGETEVIIREELYVDNDGKIIETPLTLRRKQNESYYKAQYQS